MLWILEIVFVRLRLIAGIAEDVTEVAVEGMAFPLAFMVSSATASAVGVALGLRRSWVIIIVPVFLWTILLWFRARYGFYDYFWDTFDLESRMAFPGPVCIALYIFLPFISACVGAFFRGLQPNRWREAGLVLLGGTLVSLTIIASYYPILVGQIAMEKRWVERLDAINTEWREMKTELLRYRGHGGRKPIARSPLPKAVIREMDESRK